MKDYQGVMTGYEFYTVNDTDVFFGVVVVDTRSNWQAFDWGHSLIPESQLSSQVIIGDGRKCLNTTDTSACDGDDEGRNYVYVTPVADAKIRVSFNGETSYAEYDAKALSTLILGDDGDLDMSGAYIFATKPNATADGAPVDIAVVWGQDPYSDSTGQSQAVQLDMVSALLPCKIFIAYDVPSHPISSVFLGLIIGVASMSSLKMLHPRVLGKRELPFSKY